MNWKCRRRSEGTKGSIDHDGADGASDLAESLAREHARQVLAREGEQPGALRDSE